MSLIHEYGEMKYNDGFEQGIEQVIVSLLKSGEDAGVIAVKSGVSLEYVLEVKGKFHL